jgi:two-component system, chemotaxis family, protein-glutamate methylesterase/glutaminase
MRARVLVVDDSAVIRRLVSEAISSDPALEVVGTAPNGRVALAKLPRLAPDLVTLDVEMPVMDGLATLAALRADYPKLPVVMFSNATARGAATTLEALFRGANEYVTKPANVSGLAEGIERVRADLIPKIKALCGLADGPAAPTRPGRVTPRRTGRVVPLRTGIGAGGSRRVDAVVVAVSTGGPNALSELLPALPADLPVPVIVVQHMPPMFTTMLAERLDGSCALSVTEGYAGRCLGPGQVWIAPGGLHLEVVPQRNGPVLHTTNAPPENSCRPSADVLFRSAAQVWGPNLLAVILTGMGQDGLRGTEAIRASGGQVIVQDEATSVVWGMPGAVVRAGLAHDVLPIERLAGEIVRRVSLHRAPPVQPPPRGRPVAPVPAPSAVPPAAARAVPSTPRTEAAARRGVPAAAAHAVPAARAAASVGAPVGLTPVRAAPVRAAPVGTALVGPIGSPVVRSGDIANAGRGDVESGLPLALTEAQFGYVADLVRRSSAIVIDTSKGYLVESRLTPIAQRHGLGSVRDLVQRLQGSVQNGLHAEVIDAMTTNETSWYRDVSPFQALEKWVLPALLKARAESRQLVIWSAACSSGQEPYSIAMLLREHFGELTDWYVRILASDLSTKMLTRAATGRYTQLEVNRGLPANLLVKYFTRDGMHWQISDEIRRMVEFRSINLVQPWPHVPTVDVVLLRNVLIYFDLPTKRAVLDRVRRIMRPDGYLFLGAAESPLNIHDGYARAPFDRSACYQPQ